MEKKRNLTPLYLLINLGILIAIVVINPELKNIDEVLVTMDYKWVTISVGFMIIFWLLDTIIVSYIMNLAISKNMGFFDMFTFNMIGRYYASLVPLGGGQAAQIVYLSKRDIPPGKSSSMLMMKFWIHQTALAVYAIFTFLFKGNMIKQQRPYIFWAGIFGFCINIIGPLILYILSSKEGLINNIMSGIVNFFRSRGKGNKTNKLGDKAIKFANDYSKAVDFINKNIKELKLPLILSFFQIAVFYAIPYLIYRGCGLSEAGLIDIMLTNVFLHFAVCFIPTPGAAGASEGGFLSLFSLYFPKDLMLVAMLFWRLISFYLTLTVGGAMVFAEQLRAKN